MQYRTLGRTGLRVSVIGIGTWQFGGEWGQAFTAAEVHPMLARGRELGCNLIDTAECYGDHLSESLIGEYLAASKTRDQWIIATKFGHRFTGHLQRSDDRTPAEVRAQLEGSLRALRTDYIDLYQYHSWRDQEFENSGVRDVLLQAQQAGKIRHIGNSVGPNDQPHQVRLAPDYHVEAIQIIYNRLRREPEREIFALCQQQDLGVLARVPLASGFLSGKYQPGTKFSNPADVRARQQQDVVDQRLAEVAAIQQSEVPPGIPMAQWALAWCLRNPAVSCVIPGCQNVAQVEANARAGE